MTICDETLHTGALGTMWTWFFKISRKTAAAEFANESELNEGLCSITFVVKISSFRTAEFFSCVEKLYLQCN